MTPNYVKINTRIDENIQNESWTTSWVDPVFELYANPKNSPLEPKKSKTTPKLSQSQNQKSELKELHKIKVVQLHE